ncbi:helix-turn-helix domain-containing protein [soil metagenome]
MTYRIPQSHAFEVADDAGVSDWERHNAAALIELSCRVRKDVAFRAYEVNLQLEQVGLALVRGTAHVVVRDEPMIASRPADAIAVYAALRGDAILEHAGERRVVRPGQLLVCDVDKPFLRGFGHGLEELAVKVPRSAFEQITGQRTVAQPMIIETRQDPYAQALVKMVGRAVHQQVPADEQAVLELVAVLATGGRIGLPLAHRAAARAFIDDHLRDPSLSAADVAAGAGISERHLSRLFSDGGGSVPRHILGRRLDLAYSLLNQTAARTVDVATDCGFTSMAYFSQAFSRRFGISAGQVRRGGHPAPDGETR